MCEARVFLLRGDREEKIMDQVDEVHVDGQEVKIIRIFGEQKILRARIRRYSNGQGKIVVEGCDDAG